MQKIIFEGTQPSLKEGIDLVANAVKVTAGPKGRNVIIDRGMGMSEITNDGVTVARAVDSDDPITNMGVTLVQEACSDTEASSGDGTTAAAVLLQEMVAKGIKAVSVGSNVIALKKGMGKATASILKALDQMALSIDDDDSFIRKVATISTNNDDELGGVIADAFQKVGKQGIIAVDDSDSISLKTELMMAEGLKFDRGYRSQFFMTDIKTGNAELAKPYILVTDHRIQSAESLEPIVDLLPKDGILVVISDAVGDLALTNLIMAHVQEKVKLCLVKTPGYGDSKVEMSRDLCAAIGARYISTAKGDKLEDVVLEDLGRSVKMTVTQNDTTIVGGSSDEALVAERIENVKSQLDTGKLEDHQIGVLNERLAMLDGGVAVIKLGAASETELKEKRRRFDDALAATRAAISEGVVPGGGMALMIAHASLEPFELENADEELGVNVVMDSLIAPFRTILANGGYNHGTVLAELKSEPAGFGLNVKTGEYVNMNDEGIVDPVKVIKSSLTNASSVASMMLTTEVLICNVENKEEY